MDWRPIYAAASNNNVEELSRLENEGLSLSLADPVGHCSPLYSACWYGCLEAASFILNSEEGSLSINTPTVHGATPAYAASLRGNINILKLLHNEGADLTTPDENGVTPLRASMWFRHSECFDFLLSVDDVLSKINFIDKNGMNVLWVAVERGDEHAIKHLKNHGATFGKMPEKEHVIKAIEPPEHCPTVALLNDQTGAGGQDGNGQSSVYRSSAAHVAAAASLGDYDELVRLAAVGEKVDSEDSFGITPLRLACEGNHETCVRFLVKRGSNKEARDFATGSTPMHVAAGKGHTESVCVLLENGADVTSERALDGATPLWVACDAGHLNTAAALLDHPNINPNARNNEGTSPIESACSRNHHHVVELLISKGVSSFVDSNLW
eukprot:CAMPEP_0114340852 /NCGR_PEP_ID=MMETSP0101-20121206/8643_1 /TAXON_ID=38822 ORGANISM="Pteridomonas danica, Strain PT" /NCGR_SAMPLE_ID=MMETSP0101 /ASSEMBLY_ACC=CAM_ASM_000211 /LENGTH=381 /DNA_ID=CAMNT_0001474233 /DNA_START=154 /DNA_END=1296 /DNA_ORIENTATION=+